MRDPKRIDEVLAALKKAWEASPDQRLGQLIHNAAHHYHVQKGTSYKMGNHDIFDPFYIEDDEMQRILNELSTIWRPIDGSSSTAQN